MPRTKEGVPRRGRTPLDCAGVAHCSHTPDMYAFRSLSRSKIVTAKYAGHFVTDP